MTLSELINGQSMGKLGEFEFYMSKNAYKKISQDITATFGSFTPIKGQERLSDSGGYDRKISLDGVLVVQPLDSLKTLEDYVTKREPIRFTTLNHDIEVVIPSLNMTQEHFLDDGNFTVQNYNLSLKEVYDELV
jgi:phage protein U